MEDTDWTQLDEAIRAGGSSIEVWTRLGRRLGVSLEMVVMRRRSLRAPRGRRPAVTNVLPLFAAAMAESKPLVANG